MNYKVGTIRKFKTQEDFEAAGRVFSVGSIYEATYQQWDSETLNVVFVAEFGCFNFSSDQFERVIKEWDLIEVWEL